jgi:NIMA (never in mitosis gene a)-related kinase
MENKKNYFNTDNFKNERIIGKGSFGEVYKVSSKFDQKIYAMKKILIENPKLAEQFLQEGNILSQLDTEYIVKYYYSYSCKNYLYIFMEYCDSGDLSELIQKYKKKNCLLAEDKLLTIFQQISTGLKYLHDNKYIHRDLKCKNIFLTSEGIVKIGDFGVAKHLNKDFTNTMVGTPMFFSPEIANERPYGKQSDMWSLGCILYEMMTFKYPFTADSFKNLTKKIILGKYDKVSESIIKFYSKGEDLVKVLNFLLEKQPQKRFNIDQVLTSSLFCCNKLLLNKIEGKENNNHTIKSDVIRAKSPLKRIQSAITPAVKHKIPQFEKLPKQPKKQELIKRVRANPKMQEISQLSRQAILAGKRYVPVQCQNLNKDESQIAMEMIENFDKDFHEPKKEKCKNNNDQDVKNLSASAFIKDCMKTEEYNKIFYKEINISENSLKSHKKEEENFITCPIISNLEDICEISSLNYYHPTEESHNYNKLVRKAVSLIGEEKYSKIENHYLLLQSQTELSDKDFTSLDNLITDLLDATIYSEFLELFYQIIFSKYMDEISCK